MRDESLHKEMKRKVASAYSQTEVLESEASIDKCTLEFTAKLDSFVDRSEQFDLGTWLQYYAFDVVGELTFGKSMGFLKAGKDIEMVLKSIYGMVAYGSFVGLMPYLHLFLLGSPLVKAFLPALEATDATLKFTVKTMKDCLERARSGQTLSKRDMCSKWTAIDAAKGPKLSEVDLISNLTSNMAAGSDTTAIALRSIFYHLIKNPEKMAKVVREIEQADTAGLLSEVIQFKESKKHLPYLDAVLKEGMRIHPSVGLLLERHVPAGGREICGHFLPAGTVVGINPWVVHRNADIFPDPDSFIPERWIKSAPEKLKTMEQSILTFGAGARTCIGKNISLMEMAKIVPQLLRRYEFVLAPGKEEWITWNYWFVFQDGLICTPKRRSCAL